MRIYSGRRWLIPGYWPIYLIIALSAVGTIFFINRDINLVMLLSRPWSLSYILLSPFLHAGLGHFILNAFALHFIGGQLLLPILGARLFLVLFAVAAVSGTVANNILGDAPAIGISAAILGMLSCALYPFGRVPMKLLFIHDILRLRPFPLWGVAAFVVMLDLAGIIFGWQSFAHWAHLAGFATGGIFGWFIFRQRMRRQMY